MGRFWSRHLLYGETRRPASPMWARDPTYVPIFEEPIIAASPMWRSSLRLTNVPIFVDEYEPSSEPMWYREATHVPVCPCCIGVSTMSLSRLPSTCRQVSAECAGSETSSVRTTKPESPLTAALANIRLRRSVSSLGLRFKRSMRSLRHKASGLQR
ncbi:hypothetical protein VMCG_05825 [Cytospora schulzeri]|uniref:Uncharacterized protein n=1 Tax=Cytospora schulzeri TaxID=448051 RepID=A0A423WI70_9PEZI|nr:hypothetical protein VMCG_05825 [Valsa malicola]